MQIFGGMFHIKSKGVIVFIYLFEKVLTQHTALTEPKTNFFREKNQ